MFHDDLPRFLVIFPDFKLSKAFNDDFDLFYFSIYREESSQLTHIFQRGWNHQPASHEHRRSPWPLQASWTSAVPAQAGLELPAYVLTSAVWTWEMETQKLKAFMGKMMIKWIQRGSFFSDKSVVGISLSQMFKGVERCKWMFRGSFWGMSSTRLGWEGVYLWFCRVFQEQIYADLCIHWTRTIRFFKIM